MNRAIIILLLLSLTGCATTPVIDSRGGSGNIAHNAERQHDDLYTCLAIADDNNNDLLEATKKGYNWLVRPQTIWLITELRNKKKIMVYNCIIGRVNQI